MAGCFRPRHGDVASPIARILGKAMTLVGSKQPDMRLFVEASGAITIETIDGYADVGVDFVSFGSFTNSALMLDIDAVKG
ncbi:MAG: hypothetical protein QMA93_01285 [Acidimicrobiales bacterium]|jgi:nicotinate-nucleotide pyrophosphorylase